MNPNDVPVRTLLEAAAFAAECHRTQRRKDNEATPYINHPLQVARVLACEGGVTEPAVLVAALLHDTVEDTDATPQDIEQRFGPDVRAYVEEVTDDKSLPKAERKRLQVKDAPSKSPGAAQIKIAACRLAAGAGDAVLRLGGAGGGRVTPV